MENTTNPNQLLSLYRAINNGEFDNSLDGIAEWIRERKMILKGASIVGISPGDTVRFTDTIRPKYLVGKTATVVKINSKSIMVSCPHDPSYGRFSGLSKIRCPKSLIEGAE